ncbi:MAG: 1-deoxy-D-xylulose-5-phosphate reductoisomerase [Desulfuromonadaceae bacterium]|nr:1-deoxy-D-xylulose-5-phosphate reductoisomerase [Desulfuromonadaceae bacterium]
MKLKHIAVLGSTGSIGVSTLEIVRAFPARYNIVTLAAGRNIELLEAQIREFAPMLASVESEVDAAILRQRVADLDVEVVSGVDGMRRCATWESAQMVVSAIVGAAGLVPTLAAIEAGKDIALANKEVLVAAGELVMQAVKKRGVRLLPVDSEHSAVFQSMAGQRNEDIRRIILTASGGSLWHCTPEQLERATPQQALAHPNWDMGRKISIDSATMMNKGLEVIEAAWLFDLRVENIDVHIHPQSIVHSMVEYVDGAVMAQLGVPDMKAPIAYALAWPERLTLNLEPLDLCKLSALTFYLPDNERFPCLYLAYQAMQAGGGASVVMNAANEIAVSAFLHEQIGFMDIPKLIQDVLDGLGHQSVHDLDDILYLDSLARTKAKILSRTSIYKRRV